MIELPLELPRHLIEPVDVAYAAGFFDGEGTVSIGRIPSGFRAQVVVNNTDLFPLEWLRERWGGKVYKFRPPGVGFRRQSWQWVLPERRIVGFLSDVLPYLKIKRPVAENAIAFLQLKVRPRRGRRQSETILKALEGRWQIHRAIQLERRPPPAHKAGNK